MRKVATFHLKCYYQFTFWHFLRCYRGVMILIITKKQIMWPFSMPLLPLLDVAADPDHADNHHAAEEATVNNHFERQIKSIRRYKKFNFWMNPGCMKISTMHSFKGWEVATLFLILENEKETEEGWLTEELMYTAMTRCRQNLIVINLGNHNYHRFFADEIEQIGDCYDYEHTV